MLSSPLTGLLFRLEFDPKYDQNLDSLHREL